jgi:excisionase family DNA binding protein
MTDEHPGTDTPAPPATTAAEPASTAASADLDDDGSVSLDEAAHLLGVSERSVRRRIKAGELAAYKLETPRGEVWRVQLDRAAPSVRHPGTDPGREAGNAATTAAETAGTAAVAGDRPEVLKALEVIDELRLDNRKLADMNTQLAGQVGYLQRQVQEQQETIQRLLMAPKDEAEPASEVAERRPWWKFWSRG